MAFRVLYDDYLNREVVVMCQKAVTGSWYSTQAYIDRVIGDGGKIEAPDCVQAEAERLMEPVTLCGADEPLTINWEGKRGDSVMPSYATLNIVVKTLDERNVVADIFNGGYFMSVTIDGELFWIGKVTPRWTTEAYKQFPYTLVVNANDQLSNLKKQQPLMIDYPEPFTIGGRTQLMDFFNRMFTIKKLWGGGSNYYLAPNILNLAPRLYLNTYNHLEVFQDVYIDPINFMDEDDQYMDWWKIIEAILEPLQLKLMMWKAEWWIVAKDAMYDHGGMLYRQYSLNQAGWAHNYDAGLRQEVLDLYPLHGNERQVHNSAELAYIPPSKGLEMTLDFQQNTNILPAFANRSGSFYYGHDGVQLEFESDAKTLRHWEYLGAPPLDIKEYDRNAGYMSMPLRNNVYLDGYVQALIELPDAGFDGFEIGFNSFTDNDYRAQNPMSVGFNIIYKSSTGQEYYFWKNDDGDFEWNENFRTLWSLLDQSTVLTGLALPGSGGSGTTLTVNIRGAFVFFTPENYQVSINQFHIKTYQADWDAANYKQTLNFIYLIDGSEAFTNKTWMWGIYHSDLDNNHAYHRSAPYLVDGTPIQYFRKYGTSLISPLYSWYQRTFQMDNAEYTQQLKGTYLNQLMSPLRLFKDYEGKYYDMTSGTYSVRRGEWDVLMTEYKDVLGDGSEPKGDFNTKDWNQDYFIINTHAPEIVTHNTDDVYHDGQLVTHILPT